MGNDAQTDAAVFDRTHQVLAADRSPDGEASDADDYPLGHSDAEMARLGRQAALVDPITRRFFEAAGIAPGMRVLDVGSGAGDVAILLAQMVGPDGAVVGADPSAVAIRSARRRVAGLGLTNVTFAVGDPSEMTFDGPFDAVAGRYVLMFLPDPTATIRRLARTLRGDGRIVFHEADWAGAHAVPASPTYDAVCRWIVQAVERGGATTDMGFRLSEVFRRAGLPSPVTRAEAVVGDGPNAEAAVRLVTELLLTLVPKVVESGIACPDEIAPDTLVDRIMAEIGAGGTVVGRFEVGCWSIL